MTFWSLTNSDFQTNQIFHQYHDLDIDFDLHRIMSGFHGTFATDVTCQQRTLILSGHLVCPPPPIFGLDCAPIDETRFLKLAMSLLGISPRIPLGTFLILFFILHVYHNCPFPPMKLVAHCAVSSQVLSWLCLVDEVQN